MTCPERHANFTIKDTIVNACRKIYCSIGKTFWHQVKIRIINAIGAWQFSVDARHGAPPGRRARRSRSVRIVLGCSRGKPAPTSLANKKAIKHSSAAQRTTKPPRALIFVVSRNLFSHPAQVWKYWLDRLRPPLKCKFFCEVYVRWRIMRASRQFASSDVFTGCQRQYSDLQGNINIDS